MPFPYDKYKRGGKRVVPLDVARQLAEERKRLMAELEKANRENDRLKSTNQSLRVELESLENEVDGAREEAEYLRRELAQRAGTPETGGEETGSDETGGESAEVLDQLNRRIASLTNDLQRIRGQTEKTVQDARRDERVRLLSGLGDVLDSVERALDIEDVPGPWRQGLEAIRGQIHAYMKSEGAVLLGEVGEQMDPRIHEAVNVVDAEGYETGEVVHVDRHGIELEDGTVARPAQVQVAA